MSEKLKPCPHYYGMKDMSPPTTVKSVGTKKWKMTRLEKVLSMNTGCSKMELIFCCCPHDFGIEDDSKPYKSGWECKAPYGCEGCWNREVEDEKN